MIALIEHKPVIYIGFSSELITKDSNNWVRYFSWNNPLPGMYSFEMEVADIRERAG